jgi:hypothetical protein
MDAMYAENAETFFNAKWLNFRKAADRSIRLSLFRVSSPPSFRPTELFKIAPGHFIFTSLFLDKYDHLGWRKFWDYMSFSQYKGTRTRARPNYRARKVFSM